MNQQEQIKNIDLMKFLMAILVVCLHTNPFWDISFLLNSAVVFWIARLAVPFFFICTGFFLEKKESYDSHKEGFRGKHQVVKLLKMYLIWNIIYLIVAFCTKSTGLTFSLKELIIEIVVRGGVSILWYIHATVVAIILINFFDRLRIKPIVILIIAIIFFIIGLMGQSYFSIFRQLSLWDIDIVHRIASCALSVLGIGGTRHGLFFGFPFVYLGTCVARYSNKIQLKRMTSIFVISMFFGFFEALVGLKLHLGIRWDLMVFILPATVSLFCILLKLSPLITIDTHILRNLSSDIYFIHGVLIMIYMYFDFKLHSFLRFIVIFLSSICISMIKIYCTRLIKLGQKNV